MWLCAARGVVFTCRPQRRDLTVTLWAPTRSFPTTVENIAGAPQIFYDLDEIFYQFIKNDGDVVALCLDYMRRNSKSPFNFSSEVEFRRKDSDSTLVGEIDFCATLDGVLAIGEAKKNGQLGQSNSEIKEIAQRYASLAEMLHARRVLFGTTSQEWKFSTIDAVRRAFDGKLAVPTFITAKQLFDETSE